MNDDAGIFELRTYVLSPHNREQLYARFRDHTRAIFARLGFQVIGFWTVSLGHGEGDFVYLLRWDSAADRGEGWRRFAADEQWQRVRATTNAEAGPLVTATHSSLLSPTDFSPLQ